MRVEMMRYDDEMMRYVQVNLSRWNEDKEKGKGRAKVFE